MSGAADRDALRAALEPEIDGARLRAGEADRDAVDGVTPSWVARPADEAELARVLAAAARAGAAVLPAGSGAHRTIGNPPARGDLLLELAELDGVVELEARDQFLVVGAGTTLDQAERLARDEGLTLGADFPLNAPGTVGGAVARGASGLARLAARGARHGAIGLRVAHPDGAITRHGTRVPKNVAGLDLVRLHAGALGTLGVITEVTLRLRALPPTERTVVAAPLEVAVAIEEALAAVGEGLLPEAVGLSYTGSTANAEPRLAVRFSGEPERVRWQAGRAAARLRGEILGPSESSEHWRAVSEALALPTADDALVLELRGLPDRLAAALTALDTIAPDLERRTFAHAASGEARVSLAELGAAPGPLRTTRVVTELRRALAPTGSVRVLSAPPTSKREIDVWPDPGGALELMRATKAALDPDRVLNPGRFVGRL